ncbi:arsenate reductase ArsC [bacterium]|nr:arsenate reductase ArsC [bacterium]
MKKINILFLCTGNSCRSQMAEGWAKHLRATEIEAYSAGTHPHPIMDRTQIVMKEVGVDLSDHYEKHTDDLRNIEFDYVITLCSHADAHCPIFPGKTKVIHVPFDDPYTLAKKATSEEGALKIYRRIRDEIKVFIDKLPNNLTD